MQYRNTSASGRIWYDSGHASLCLLGVKLRRMGLFKPLEAHVKIGQKVLKYTPVQKLEMFLVAVLAGAKAVSHTTTTVRLDPALISAFGLPGCADQSSIAQTLNAATEQDVADLQAALGEFFGSYSQARSLSPSALVPNDVLERRYHRSISKGDGTSHCRHNFAINRS